MPKVKVIYLHKLVVEYTLKGLNEHMYLIIYLDLYVITNYAVYASFTSKIYVPKLNLCILCTLDLDRPKTYPLQWCSKENQNDTIYEVNYLVLT